MSIQGPNSYLALSHQRNQRSNVMGINQQVGGRNILGAQGVDKIYVAPPNVAVQSHQQIPSGGPQVNFNVNMNVNVTVNNAVRNSPYVEGGINTSYVESIRQTSSPADDKQEVLSQ